MGNNGRIDIDKFISYSKDLVQVLKMNKDFDILLQTLQDSKTFRSSCEADFRETHNLLREYENKISSCKQRIDEVKLQGVSDVDLDNLEKELQEEVRKENVLKEELRDVNSQIGELEHQRIRIEENKKIMDKSEKDELRAEKLLSMYASVTNIIPNMYNQNNTSGHIVDRDKKIAEMFEFDPANASSLEICNNLWKTIIM